MPSKPSPGERKRNYCDDAIEAIDAILQYVHGMDFGAYERDRKTISAVEREILTIAEVIVRLKDFETAYEGAYQIRGLANRLRHEYQRIDDKVIWDIITGRRLPDLKATFETYRSSIK